MSKTKRYAADGNIMSAIALIGVAGWVILVLPELHFLYKHLMPVLGDAKYLAFLLMGIAMFLCLPIVLTRKAFKAVLAFKCQSVIEKLMMVFLCILSVVISRGFM